MEFWYAGYGSNIDLNSLRAKGVEPRLKARCPARLATAFQCRHFLYHEGGVGNIEPSDYRSDVVWGVLHRCDGEHLALLDAAEVYDHCYNQIEVTADTKCGEHQAITYVGIPSFLDEACRPKGMLTELDCR